MPTKHTPGPWAWRGDGSLGAPCGNDFPGTHAVLTAEVDLESPEDDETWIVWARDPDKALIAGAPAVYDAALALLKRLETATAANVVNWSEIPALRAALGLDGEE